MIYPVPKHSWTQSVSAAPFCLTAKNAANRSLLSRCFLCHSAELKESAVLNGATIALRYWPVVKRQSQICDFFVNWTFVLSSLYCRTERAVRSHRANPNAVFTCEVSVDSCDMACECIARRAISNADKNTRPAIIFPSPAPITPVRDIRK